MAEVPMVQTAIDKKMPNLIPADDSDGKSSDNEENKEDEYFYEPMPKYNTRTQAAKQKVFRNNVTREAILSAVEMSFECLNPAKLVQWRFPLQTLCEIARAVMDDETGEL